MFGLWKCTVSTPFGDEDYSLSIRSDGSTIYHNTGNVEIDIYSYQKNEFFFEKFLDFPIKCKVTIKGFAKNDFIYGIVKIDEYLELAFKGKNDSIST